MIFFDKMKEGMKQYFDMQRHQEEAAFRFEQAIDLGEKICKNEDEGLRDMVEYSRIAFCSFFAKYEV